MSGTLEYGFEAVYSLSGEIGRTIECAALTAASDLFVGDPVKFSGTGDSSSRPSVTVAAAGDTSIMGVVASIKATGPDGLFKQYSDSADTIIVQPALPFLVFRVHAATATGTRLDNIGLLFDHIAGTGDTLAGRSRYGLDMASAGATTAKSWRFIGFDKRADNTFSTTVSTDTADTDLLVVCVESIWNYGVSGTVGEGV